MVYEIDVSKGGIIRSKGSGKRRYCGLSNIFLAKKYRFTIKKLLLVTCTVYCFT